MEDNFPIKNIDKGIRELIFWLNKNKFKTIFSCEGHYHTDYINCFYVLFEYNEKQFNFLKRIIKKSKCQNLFLEKYLKNSQKTFALRYNYTEFSEKQITASKKEIDKFFDCLKGS